MSGIAALRPVNAPLAGWWTDRNMLSLVRRTTCKDCNNDEFDEFVSVCRDLNLAPARRQIYCFIFNKDDAAKRQMTLVVAIDGGRSIAARTGNYRPDDQEPQWVFKDELKNPLTNPHGIEKCTVGIFHRPTRNDPFERIVHTVFWDEFAPIVSRGDPDAYEWVPTGRVHPEGHKRAGQSIDRKQLRPGASANIVSRLDPDKAQWIRAGRNQIAKCAEMGALRKGWPEDLSRVVVEEETDRAQAQTVDLRDDEYSHLTPSEMAAKGEADARLERIGGPSLYAVFDDTGTLEGVPMGKFFDRVDAHTKALAPAAVALFVKRNTAGLQAFWAHNKNDALELKKILEARSGAVAGTSPPAGDQSARAHAAPPQQGETVLGGAAAPSKQPKRDALPKLTGLLAERHRDNLIKQIGQMETLGDLLIWARDGDAEIARLPEAMAEAVRAEFNSRQNRIKESQK